MHKQIKDPARNSLTAPKLARSLTALIIKDPARNILNAQELERSQIA